MHSIQVLVTLVLITLINNVLGQKVQSYSRDGYGRYDPNRLLNGFFPAWAILMLCLAGFFLLISIVSFALYTFGCKPKGNFKKLNNKPV